MGWETDFLFNYYTLAKARADFSLEECAKQSFAKVIRCGIAKGGQPFAGARGGGNSDTSVLTPFFSRAGGAGK
jgi:hypothetical protein